ncbi:hypothetical protein QUF76_05005 [Desulfobacterales bacterium HSG16]|nr:hypothetical protein [Desulfobacterales bacterium HSG16]
MQQAIKIKTHIATDTLSLPIPKGMIGKDAEIIVLVKSDDILEETVKPRRMPGSAKGMITMSDDFEKPLDDEMLAEFYK